MDKEREAYLKRISDLEQEKQSLLEEIKRLRTDKAHIESLARRELGLIKDDEILYRFMREKDTQPSSEKGKDDDQIKWSSNDKIQMSNKIQNPNFLKRISNQPKNPRINIEQEIMNVEGRFTVHGLRF